MITNTVLPEADSDQDLVRPFQIKSHENLLQFPDIPVSTIDIPSGKRAITEPLVDAIVVPTIRTAEHLVPAARLAVDARCHLIVIYTDKPPAGLQAVLGGLRPDKVTLLSVRSGTQNRLIDLGTTLPQGHVSFAALDISRKRNLGVLIGRACGWTRMLFLDDDIRKLSVGKLSSAAALLDEYPVVGLQVTKFPDASVVGHARRLTGRRQEPFVSGGSLLVNPQILNGYFAPVYHEDWLCIINHLRESEVAIGGSVTQKIYVPFKTERARLEEFGDILLSGLLWLVHARGADKVRSVADADYWQRAANPGFWEQIIEERGALLQEISTRLEGMSLNNPLPLPSVAAARRRLCELKPADFVSFMERWLASLDEWRGQLSVVPRVDSPDKQYAIEKALARLGLANVVRSHELPSRNTHAKETGRIGRFADRCNRWIADGRSRFAKPHER